MCQTHTFQILVTVRCRLNSSSRSINNDDAGAVLFRKLRKAEHGVLGHALCNCREIHREACSAETDLV